MRTYKTFFLAFSFAILCVLFFSGSLPVNLNHLVSKESSLSKNHSNSKHPLAHIASTGEKGIQTIDLEFGLGKRNISLDFSAKILTTSSDGKILYVADRDSEQLYRIDLSNGDLHKLNTPKGIPHRLAVSSSNLTAYACYENSHGIYRLDFDKEHYNSLIKFKEIPEKLILNPSETHLYVLLKESLQLVSIDLVTAKVDTLLTLKTHPEAFIMSMDGEKIYLLQEAASLLTSVDLATKTAVTQKCENAEHRKYAGNSLKLGLNSRKNEMYLTEESTQEIYKLDLNTRKIDTALEISSPVESIDFCPEAILLASFVVSNSLDGNHVLFDASATKSFREGQIDYYWDFGDGFLAFSEDPYIEHAYEVAGEYFAVLTAVQAIAPHPLKLIEKNSSVDLKRLFSRSHEKVAIAKTITGTNDESLIIKAPTIPTSSSFISSSNPSTFQQSVTFTATLSVPPASGTPTGSFTFMDGVTNIGTVSLSGLSAALTVPSFSVGTHPITIDYSGDASFQASTSPTINQIVNPSTTTTNLISSPNPSVFGQSILLTATATAINPGAVIPTGTVTFKDGGTTLGTSSLISGVATFSTSGLTVATHSLTAVYNADVNFLTSTSNTVSQVVGKAATNTALISSVNPTIFGNATLLTATINVTSGAGTPTGTVTFKNGTTTIGTGTVAANVATLSISNLGAGINSLTAVYNGDGNFVTSVSGAVAQTVNKGTTLSTLTSSVPTTTYGAATTFTATVSVATGAGIPTGYFTFKDGATTLGTVNLTGLSSALTLSNLSVGTHPITAIYSGDTNFQTSTSSPAVSQVVNKATPTIALTASPTSSNYGDLVTYTTTVSAPTSLGLPSGTITYLDGVTVIGTATLNPTGATTSTATLAIKTLYGGTHSITASYSGDGNFVTVTSTPAISFPVSPLPTTTALFVGSANATVYGEPVILVANVTGSVANPPLPPSGTVTFYDGATNLGTTSLAGIASNTSSATFTYTNFSIGPHVLSAVYSADINYTASTSPNITHTVIQADTSSVVTSSVTPAVYGQSVVFTSLVSAISPGAGNATGPVNFYDGTTLLGTGTLTPLSASVSKASLTVSNLSLGTHFIFASYPDDANFTSSTSSGITQVVIKDPTTTLFSSSLPTSNFGDLVTWSATVTANVPGSGIPTGTVTFYNGSTAMGTATLNGSGAATYSSIALYPGTHPLKAIYNGDINYLSSTSLPFTQTVINQLPTLTTVTSARNSSPVNNAVIYRASVTAITGIPTGTVSFYDNGVFIATGTINSNGVATVTQPGASLSASPTTHPITAIYSGDANFITSTSAIYNEYVVPYDTVTVLATTPNHSEQANATFTATVTPSGTPTPIPVLDGTVIFYDGGVAISGPLPVPPNGVVTFQPIDLHFNGRAIRAVYSGDQTQFATSTSNIINQQVQQTDMLTTQTVVTTSQSTTYYCQPVTFRATVVQTQGFYTPTGTVTFFDGTTSLGTAILNGSGVAMLPVSTLPVGTHSVSATYNSDSNYAFSSSNSIVQTVIVNPTTTSLVLIPSIPLTPYGQNLIFVATVQAPYNIPTGQVTFSDEKGILSEVDLDASGMATYSTISLRGGVHVITATYKSSCCASLKGCYGDSSASLNHTVTPTNPMLALAATPSPGTYGNTIRLTASIAAYQNGTPTGSVSFYQGATFLGKSAIAEGVANLTVSGVTAGLKLFNAVYNGDENFNVTSFPSFLETVNKANVTVSLSSPTPNPSEYGQTFTLNADVISLISIPTGSVSFFWNATLIGTVPVNAKGAASINYSTLPIGANVITAAYNGDSNFNTATSPALTQSVVKSKTVTTITSTSPSPSTFNSPVTVNVSVVGTYPGAVKPTGTITGFLGSTNLGTATLSGGIASFVTSVLPASTNTLSVTYNGDSNFSGSTGLRTHTVNSATTTVASITSSSPTAVFGQSVTFSATVSSSAGIPTGSVTFYDGTTQIGIGTLNSSGTAAFSTSALSVATHTIKAVYSGSNNFATATSANLTQTVNKAATTTLLSSNSTASVFGQLVTFTANVNPTSPGAGNPTGTITFKNGVTTLGTVTLSNGGIGTFTTSSLAASGTAYNITAVYAGDTNFSTSTSSALLQTVNPISTIISAASTVNPSTLGQSVTYNVSVNAINGTSIPDGTVTATYGATVIGTGSLSGAGTISITTSTLPAGTLPIIFSYVGNSNFKASSTTFDQAVQTASTTTVLTTSLTPSYVGESITLTATIASPTGTSTGTVAFFDGTALIGTQTLTGSTASLSISTLTLGTHALTASYNGDTSHAISTSPAIAQVVQQATTSIALSSSVNPTEFGQSTLLTATVAVTNGSGNLSGTVSFYDNAVLIGTRGLSGNIATLGISTLTIGSHNLTAVYSGDVNFGTSASPGLTQVVSTAATTTTVVSSNSPSLLGNPVTFTATVHITTGAGILGGTVTFRDGLTVLGSTSVFASQASFTTSALLLGAHSITATYDGDPNFATSTSGILSQVVNQGTATTEMSSNINPSGYGQPIDLMAVVSGSNSISATGTVTFFDGPLNLGIAPISGGTATLSTSALSVASHSLIAVYSGDVNYTTSTSPIYVQLVTPVSTTTTVNSSQNPLVYGNIVTFTASVAPQAGAEVPQGLVSFREGTTILGSATLSGGTASFSTADLTAGGHLISAIYLGNPNFLTSTSSSFTQVIDQGNVAVSLSSSINPSIFGQETTLTAVVGILFGVVPENPTGTVTFSDGPTIIGTGSIIGGIATCATSSLSVGVHSLTATYNGDVNYASASSPIYYQTVNQATSTTNILATTPNPSMLGGNVTFFAAVSTLTGTPSGSVSFFDGATLLGTATVYDGLAIFESNILAVGNHLITAQYSGNVTFSGSTSPAIIQTVTQSTITVTSVTTMTSNLNPSQFGQAVTFDVLVTPLAGPGIPTGVVTIYSGSIPLTTVNLVNGAASFTTANLPAGISTIVALYSGDAIYSSSTGTVAQTVTPIATTSTLTSSSINSLVFQPVTFTNYVSTVSGAIPVGTVSFYEDLTLLGTVLLDNAGFATITTSTLTPGTHLISAVYNASQNFEGSSDSLNQVVSAAATNTMILLSSPNPSTPNEVVNFIATVSSNYGIPTGPVKFYSGTSLIGTVMVSNGLAVLNTSFPTAGSYNITAQYLGSADFIASTSQVYVHVVTQPLLNTNISLSSSKNPAEFGQTVTFKAKVHGSSGTATGTVTFYDGNVSLGSALLSHGVAKLSTSTLSIGKHPILAIYSGDSNYSTSTSPILIQVIKESTVPPAPQNFYGCQKKNKYLNFDQYVNVLTWTPPQTHIKIVCYKIYRDSSLRNLVVAVRNQCPYKYEDNDQQNLKNTVYYIVSVSDKGVRSKAVSTSIEPQRKFGDCSIGFVESVKECFKYY